MRYEEAQIGKRVRVRKDHRTANLQGQEGVIVKTWGDPGHTALDVLLDKGDLQLFWYYELEEVGDDDRGARRQNEATARPLTQDPSPHGIHLVVADKEDTRVAETWLAERCTPARKISAEFHEYTRTSLKDATGALGNTFSRIHRGFIHSCSNIGAKSNARSANAAYTGRIEE